jgi:hypothetical protein
MNPTHLRPHLAHITSPTNCLKFDSHTPLVRKGTSSSFSVHQPSTSAGLLPTKRVNRRSQAGQSNRSNLPESSASTSKRKDSTKKAIHNKDCCMCRQPWIDSSEEWIRCTECKLWACESCFGSNTCYKCY